MQTFKFRLVGCGMVALAVIAGLADDSLAEFNAETITGDELVALCAKMSRPLTEQEVDSLRERLAGRRLTFTFSAWQTECWGSGLEDDWFMGVKFPDEGRYGGKRPGVLRCRFYLRDEADRDLSSNCDERNLRVTGTVNAEKEMGPMHGPIDYLRRLLSFGDSVIDRSAATTECRIPEFYGLRFGQPTQMSTNGLTRFVNEGFRSGTGRPNVKYRYQTWQRIDDGLRPAKFFDRALIAYSYKTLTPVTVTFVGHFPKGATRAECLAEFDAYAAQVNARYAARIACKDGSRNDVEPKGFVPRDPPKKLKDWTSRYFIWRKAVYGFGEYYGHINGCLLYAHLHESGYGERVVSFTVNGYSKKMPYRDIELDVGAMEGLLSYEATEAKEK